MENAIEEDKQNERVEWSTIDIPTTLALLCRSQQKVDIPTTLASLFFLIALLT